MDLPVATYLGITGHIDVIPMRPALRPVLERHAKSSKTTAKIDLHRSTFRSGSSAHKLTLVWYSTDSLD